MGRWRLLSMADESSSAEPRPTAPDALRRLEERLDRASDAAERLLADAAGSAARAAAGAAQAASRSGDSDTTAQPPPSGWQLPRREAETGSDLEVLIEV